MYFGKVIGTVVATKKVGKLVGHKLLIVQRVGYDGEELGDSIIAIDHTQAGVGDFVFMARGKDAAWPIGRNTPVDMGIMGIIDAVEIDSGFPES